jgi:hypothetical protein
MRLVDYQSLSFIVDGLLSPSRPISSNSAIRRSECSRTRSGMLARSSSNAWLTSGGTDVGLDTVRSPMIFRPTAIDSSTLVTVKGEITFIDTLFDTIADSTGWIIFA